MTDQELRRISETVNELDKTIPREGAKVRLKQYGGGPDESKIVANRLGYLRLGIEFLKAAFASPKDERSPGVIDVHIQYLLTSDSMVGLDRFERHEDLAEVEKEKSAPKFVGVVIAGLILLGAILAIIGAGTIAFWLLR